MTEINVKNVINKYNMDIKLLSCIEHDQNYFLELIIKNYNFKLITDFDNYCYVESYDFNISDINFKLIYYNKSIHSILKYLYDYEFDTKENKIIFDDKYNFYNKIEEKTKYYIDYKLLNKTEEKIKHEIIKIPKELLLNQNQIFQLIINEIKTINNNFNYKHYIYPFENNIYDLRLRIFFIDVDYIEFKIKINSSLYPFLPPKVEIIYPKVKISLVHTILNLDLFKLDCWNSSISLEWFLINIHEQLEPIIKNYIEFDNNEFTNIENLLIQLSYLIKDNLFEKIPIKLEIPKINKKTSSDKNYWKAGVGYGHGNGTSWDIKNYIKEKEIQQTEIANILYQISENINETNIKYILDSCLLNYINNELNGINLLIIENEKNKYDYIFKILEILKNFINIIDVNYINKIAINLENINTELYDFYKNYTIFEKTDNITNEYENIMKKLQFDIQELDETHTFYNQKDIKIEQKSLNRIVSEISSFKSGLPLNYDSTIWIRVPKKNINIFTFMISGPKDTPYENGLFEFHVKFPPNYPNKEPSVILKTTGNETVRFNPNLYANGKVCLSLLGTWSGSEEEKWNSKTSTFLQVLVSIQSLILVDEPYFNEPGFERLINTPEGTKSSNNYNENIQLHTFKWAIINQINNPPKGFENIIKEHFSRKKNDILNKIDKCIEKSINNKDKFQKNKEIISSLL